MKIELNQGKVLLIDDESFHKIRGRKWYFNSGYVSSTCNGKERILLHRFLMNTPMGAEVDHINGDPLDNRLSNLRLCSRSTNMRNQKSRSGSASAFKGVTKSGNKWMARIQAAPGNRIYLGLYATEKQAAVIYNVKAVELFGKFARLNEVKL